MCRTAVGIHTGVSYGAVLVLLTPLLHGNGQRANVLRKVSHRVDVDGFIREIHWLSDLGGGALKCETNRLTDIINRVAMAKNVPVDSLIGDLIVEGRDKDQDNVVQFDRM